MPPRLRRVPNTRIELDLGASAREYLYGGWAVGKELNITGHKHQSERLLETWFKLVIILV